MVDLSKFKKSSIIPNLLDNYGLINSGLETTEDVKKTVEDIKSINPQYVIPMHCTGYDAMVQFYREMPEQFVLSTAGSRFTFVA